MCVCVCVLPCILFSTFPPFDLSGILHDVNWIKKKGEFDKIPMDGVLSGLIEFGPLSST